MRFEGLALPDGIHAGDCASREASIGGPETDWSNVDGFVNGGAAFAYADGHRCEPFVKPVIETLSGEFLEQYPEEDTRSCIYGYLGWITKRQKRGELEGVDKDKSMRSVEARSKAVSAVPLLCR